VPLQGGEPQRHSEDGPRWRHSSSRRRNAAGQGNQRPLPHRGHHSGLPVRLNRECEWDHGHCPDRSPDPEQQFGCQRRTGRLRDQETPPFRQSGLLIGADLVLHACWRDCSWNPAQYRMPQAARMLSFYTPVGVTALGTIADGEIGFRVEDVVSIRLLA
jgi:hypothetical protein